LKKKADTAEARLAEVSTETVAWVAHTADSGQVPMPTDWILDSGATTHISPFRHLFSTYLPFATPRSIGTANHGSLQAFGIGDVNMNIFRDGKNVTIQMRNVLYAPECSANLTAVNALTKSGMVITFKGNSCDITDASGRFLISASRTKGQLYQIRTQAPAPASPTPVSSSTSPASTSSQVLALTANKEEDLLLLWHERMGHLNFKTLRFMVRNKLAAGLEKVPLPPADPICMHCPFGKQTVASFPFKSNTVYTRRNELVVADTFGPMPNSMGNKRYMLVFLDVFSRYTTPFFLKERSESPECFKQYHSFVERQNGEKLKVIRTDNAKEFTGGEFAKYCRDNGIKHETTAPHSSASNGIAERSLRTIQEGGLTLLHAGNLRMGFWPEAFATLVFVRNRSYHSGIKDVPYNRWFGKQPNLKILHTFGCATKILVHPNVRQNGQFHSKQGVFVGYEDDKEAYKIWVPETGRFYTSRSVIFEEHGESTKVNVERSPPSTPLIDASLDTTRPLSPLSDSEDEEQQPVPSAIPLPIQPLYPEWDKSGFRIHPEEHPGHPDFKEYGRGQRNKKQTTPSALLAEIKDCTNEAQVTQLLESFLANAAEESEEDFDPDQVFAASYSRKSRALSYEDAMKSPNAQAWKDACKKECDQMHTKKVWEVVPLPEGQEAIADTRWVLEEKFDADGNFVKNKARIVVRGFTQVPGRDYEDTYAAVPKMSTLRLLLCLTAALGLVPRQLDVVGAYLEAPLKKTIYVKPPPGYDIPPRYALHLLKACYGLKQGANEFEDHRDAQLQTIEYSKSEVDTSLFYRIKFAKEVPKKLSTIDMGLWWSDDGYNTFTESYPGRANDCVAEIGRLLPIEDKGTPKSYLGLSLGFNTQQRIAYAYQPALIDQIVSKTQR
jgi:hypothetical protein